MLEAWGDVIVTLSEQIDALIELLTPEGAWCQGSYAYSIEGGETEDPLSQNACMWCLVGGISKISGEGVLCGLGCTELYKSIESHLSEYDHGLLNWNDHEDRTQSQVIDMLKEVRGKVFKSEVDQVWE